MPKARIIHEVNAASFGNRIDVLAVDHAEVVAVEIKSEKDKPDRLPAQLTAMMGVAHHVIVALQEKFLVEQPTNKRAAHNERNGKYYRAALPEVIDRWAPMSRPGFTLCATGRFRQSAFRIPSISGPRPTPAPVVEPALTTSETRAAGGSTNPVP